MKKEREELRRGIRSFIQDAGVELAEFAGAPAPKLDEAPPAPPPTRPEMTLHLPRKGVCAAYFTNKRCWELPDAYCNHALHVCRLRECPVYDLHREEMERKFAARFKHLW